MIQISYSLRAAKKQKDLSALCTIPTPSPLSGFQAARQKSLIRRPATVLLGRSMSHFGPPPRISQGSSDLPITPLSFPAGSHQCPPALPTPPVSSRLLSNASYGAFTEHLRGYRVDFVTEDTELFTAIAHFRSASTEKSLHNPRDLRALPKSTEHPPLSYFKTHGLRS